VVAAVLGVVVLGERLNTRGAGMIVLASAVLVTVTAIFGLARIEAVPVRRGRSAAPTR
jgi:hypothetical protein